MKRIWDSKNSKFIEVEDGFLSIMRETTIGLEKTNYTSSYTLQLSNKNKTKELMDKIAILWNKSNNTEIAYTNEKVSIDESNTIIKMSLFFDKDLKEHLMKFRLIGKNKNGEKKIDYIKLDRNKSRELYANIRNNLKI